MESKKNTFVLIIDGTRAAELRDALEEKGFTITTPPYTFFAAKKPSLHCTFYTSGKLCIQGKEAKEFIEFYLEPEFLQTFPITLENLKPHLGSDEAGKGDFFGPLCVAGLYADTKGIEALKALGVGDSKTLKDSLVITLCRKLKQTFPHAIIRLYPWKYNDLYARFGNLNRMLAWAHASILEKLSKETGCVDALVDQFAKKELLESFVNIPKLKQNLVQKTKGESDLVVAAASILARGAFLEGLEKLEKEYTFKLPKGASKKVIDAGTDFIQTHGQEALKFVGKLHFKTLDAILKKIQK